MANKCNISSITVVYAQFQVVLRCQWVQDKYRSSESIIKFSLGSKTYFYHYATVNITLDLAKGTMHGGACITSLIYAKHAWHLRLVLRLMVNNSSFKVHPHTWLFVKCNSLPICYNSLTQITFIFIPGTNSLIYAHFFK